jgi:hypothetical protein
MVYGGDKFSAELGTMGSMLFYLDSRHPLCFAIGKPVRLTEQAS